MPAGASVTRWSPSGDLSAIAQDCSKYACPADTPRTPCHQADRRWVDSTGRNSGVKTENSLSITAELYPARSMRFYVLGSLQVDEQDKAIALGGYQQRAVLALLLLNAG